MKILFITQLFDPENSIKGIEFLRRLKKNGHSIEVITTFPSYPGGKIYENYNQSLRKIETVDGIKITRLPTYISHGKSSIKRIISYFSFGCVSLIYSLFFVKKPDLIYSYYPPVIGGMVVFLMKIIKKVPYVYDIQDLWPDALVATGAIGKGRIYRAINYLCNVIYKNANGIIVLSKGYKKALIERGVPSSKIDVILNWCDEGRIGKKEYESEAICDGSYFNVLYAGNMGSAQSLHHILDAARLLQNEGYKEIRFLFVGSGVEKDSLVRLAVEKNLNNTFFFPQVSVEEVENVLRSAGALLVHLANAPVFEMTIPSKVQAYLHAGRPIILAVNGEAASIIEEAEAGIGIEAENPQAIRDAVLSIYELNPEERRLMGERGRRFYDKKMSMDQGVSMVHGVIEKCLNKY